MKVRRNSALIKKSFLVTQSYSFVYLLSMGWEKPKPKVIKKDDFEFQLLEHLNKEQYLQRNDRTEERSFKLPSGANYGKVNIWEESKGVRFVFRFLRCYFWVDKSLSPVKGEFYFVFKLKKKKKQGEFCWVSCFLTVFGSK